MKSQDMFQNAYGDETFYLTVDEAVNFADTTKYIWKGGTKTILINVALSDATDIRLPEATTDNAGLQVKVVFALALGFIFGVSKIVGQLFVVAAGVPVSNHGSLAFLGQSLQWCPATDIHPNSIAQPNS